MCVRQLKVFMLLLLGAAAAQAGAIAAGFGGGGAGEKAAIVPPRYASRAHRPAVHPGGHHGDEELPVETGVAGGQRWPCIAEAGAGAGGWRAPSHGLMRNSTTAPVAVQ